MATPREAYRLNVELKGWDETLRAYQAATKKAADYVAWRAVKSMLFHLLTMLRDGKAHNYRRKPSPWGDFDGNLAAGTPSACRLVASLLRGGSSHAIARGVYGQRESVMRSKRKGHRTVIDQVAVRRAKDGTYRWTSSRGRAKIQTFYKHRGKFYTREYARAWAAAHTRFRQQHRGFIHVLPRDLIDAVIQRMRDLGMKPGGKPKNIRNPQMKARAAGISLSDKTIGGVLRIAAQTWYLYKSAKTDANQSTVESAKNLEHVLYAMLPEARRLTIIDMNHYILKKRGLWDDKWNEFLPPGM